MATRFALGLLLAFLAPSVAAASGGEELPNLRPLPASSPYIHLPDDSGQGERALRFTTTAQNAGGHSLDILTGLPVEVDSDIRFRALQCTRWTGRLCEERSDVGELFFETHPDHVHFHYADFAIYELRRIVNGSVDESEAGIVGTATKQSFCLQDTDPVGRNELQSYIDAPPFYRTCNGVSQGISPQWQDEYDGALSGQQIIIDGVADGEYAIVITLNPNATLKESDFADNKSIQRVRISGNGRVVTTLS